MFKSIYFMMITSLYGIDKIDGVIHRYKRPMTILEIGNAQTYCFSHQWSERYKNHCFVWMQIGFMNNDDMDIYPDNMLILNPPTINYDMIKRLNECEHFDLVIVHAAVFRREEIDSIFSLLKTLGEHLFIYFDQKIFSRSLLDMQKIHKECWLEDFILYVKNNEKKVLEKARWNGRELSRPYIIMSDCYSKMLYKPYNNQFSPWKPGINLITFIMLNGVYPEYKSIVRQFRIFRTIKHNDLVLGNVIIQGKSIILIDFSDTRRNANQRACIKAAQKVLRKIETKKYDPKYLLDWYGWYMKK